MIYHYENEIVNLILEIQDGLIERISPLKSWEDKYAKSLVEPKSDLTEACNMNYCIIKNDAHNMGMSSESSFRKNTSLNKSDDNNACEIIRLSDEHAQCSIVIKEWLDAYFEGRPEKISVVLPYLRLVGSDFQKVVWERVMLIPYGNITTYGQIAREVGNILGKPTMSAQAVGRAVGSNPFLILIPCHRVIASDGSMLGYFGGIEMKKKLLELENRIVHSKNLVLHRA